MKLVSNILRVMTYELRSIFCSLPVLLVMGGGVFLYGLLYNYMYSPNVLRDVPVVVVDQSRTSLSRHYLRLLDATPQVCVHQHSADMYEALQYMKHGDVYGILFLPADFDERVGRGEEAVFLTHNTTMTFLYDAALQEASSSALLALNDVVRPRQLVFLNPNAVPSIVATRSMGVQGVAMFNPLGGYADYLIPGVLMVIIFQTLLMVISMRCGREAELQMRPLLPFRNSGLWGRGSVAIVVGKALVYVGLYSLFSIFLNYKIS